VVDHSAVGLELYCWVTLRGASQLPKSRAPLDSSVHARQDGAERCIKAQGHSGVVEHFRDAFGDLRRDSTKGSRDRLSDVAERGSIEELSVRAKTIQGSSGSRRGHVDVDRTGGEVDRNDPVRVNE